LTKVYEDATMSEAYRLEVHRPYLNTTFLSISSSHINHIVRNLE
jgi:hypothetical protein